MSDPIVQTDSGPVRGRVDPGSGLATFFGIPYAAPPLGARRFRAPEPHPGWTDPLDAGAFGPASAQVFDPQEAPLHEFGLPPTDDAPDWVGSEDSLTLNVWTPAADSARRPVMVWIHGGGNWLESARISAYHGDRFARNGDVVFVNLNYRLGLFGFLDLTALPGGEAFAGSHINGLRDQRLALHWVKRNIAAFGGDPDNITVFGESAGSVNTSWHLASGTLDGLARRAILMSGMTTVDADPRTHFRDATANREIAAWLLAELGITSLPQLLEADTGDLVTRLKQVQGRVPTLMLDFLFYPRTGGGTELAENPYQWAARGRQPTMPVMIGTTGYEMGLWLLWDDKLDSKPFAEAFRFTGPLTDAEKADLKALYARVFPYEPEGVRAMHLLGDGVFVMPATLFAELRAPHGDVWMYNFALEIPGSPFRATHAIDLPYAFDRIDQPFARTTMVPESTPHEEARRRALADATHAAFLAVARHGDPNRVERTAGRAALPHWPRYDTAGRQVMELTYSPRVVPDPYAERRSFWIERLYRPHMAL